jgi:hypothetical protein
VSNGSNAPGSPASKVPSPSDPTHKTANESYSNAAHVGDIVQADISTFKGGEYYNDPSKVTAAAKAFARGQADIDDVAKSVGFANGAPDGTTPLTVEQQQMLGFREYNPTRNWNSYVTASYMWQHSHGQTSVESWMNAHNPGFTGGGVGDYKHSNSGSSSNSVIYTGSGHMAGSGNATEYQRKVSKMSMRGNGTGASGDDKLDKIVELLTAIVNNTGDINGNIGKLGNSKQILDKSGKPIVIPMQQSSDARNDIRNAKGSNGVDTTLYSLGRKIAAGGSFAKQ